MNKVKGCIPNTKVAIQTENMNDHIEEYLNYYCSLEEGPGFAVLLKGEWGVGKTWFIKNYFERSSERWGKPIYISLYGVSQPSQIEEKLFEALHPLFASKPAKLAGIVVRGLIKFTTQVDLNKDGTNDGSYSLQLPKINWPSYLTNIHKRVLVFDDLERCDLDINSVLGFINAFVEEQRSKVIILANEEKVDSKYKASEDGDGDKYRSVKEKVVGQTLTFQFDLHSAIKPFSSAIILCKTRHSFLKNAALVEEIYARADYKNLRSLKQIMLNFERIFDALPPEAQTTSGLVEDLIRSLTALSIEVQQGTLLPNQIGGLMKRHADNIVAMSASSKTNKERASETSGTVFLERYNLLFSNALFPSEFWWQRFFDEGIIDADELKSAFESSTYFQEANRPNWLKLWYFSSMTDVELKKVLSDVVSDFNNNNFKDILVIKHVFGTLLELSYNELCDEDPKQLLEQGKVYVKAFIDRAYDDGVSDLFASTELHIELLSSADEYGRSFGLAYQGSDYEEFEAFEAYALNYGETLRQEHLHIVADELLNLMKLDRWKFKRALCYDQYKTNDVKSYCTIPILHLVDVSKFVSNLIALHTIEDTGLIGFTLKERYSPSDHGLDSELAWLNELRENLEVEINSRRGTTTAYRLKKFKTNYLDPILYKN